jgi:PTS system nitrogen regulatory IIA component
VHFGATLRLLRLESGLSLRDLARRLSVSGTYLSRVENGLDSAPTPARLEAIARELDVPPPLLMGLAHRVSPLVVDYVQQEPEAGALFLEIAHRRLDGRQLAEVRTFLNERFPTASIGHPSPRGISDLLTLDRIVCGLTCSSIDDALDVAASRLASLAGKAAPVISAPLKVREREVSSAIGGGIAVPCAYLAAVDLAAVLVTFADPLKYETPDGRPLGALVVLAGPRNSRERRMRLAQLARLTARGLAEQLAHSQSPTEVLSRLASMEAL